jgi:hypothetical protein
MLSTRDPKSRAPWPGAQGEAQERGCARRNDDDEPPPPRGWEAQPFVLPGPAGQQAEHEQRMPARNALIAIP